MAMIDEHNIMVRMDAICNSSSQPLIPVRWDWNPKMGLALASNPVSGLGSRIAGDVK